MNGCFQKYLATGGFLSAIDNYEKKKKIERFVYQTYQQWVIGDFLKRNKKEHFLKEIITVLSERIASQVSLHNIASKTEIQHHLTVQEYLTILQDMDVIFIQQALREDKLLPAYKKAKKIHFADPFIAQVLISWSKDLTAPWEFAENNIIIESRIKENIIEGCVSSLLRRKYKTYYIKAEGEVDIAIISNGKISPIEIKWTETLRNNELKQIFKYKTGIIGYKGLQFGRHEHLYVLPIPVIASMI
jgi:predicted AAA+ superfamily ATPase